MTKDINIVLADELAAIVRDRARAAALRAELGALVLDLHRREREIIRRIEAGAAVKGEARVIEHRTEGAAWLAVIEDELGAEVVERVKKAWPVAVWKELQIA